MKVLLCCIGKDENKYIREYVDHYRKIGIDNICLYDNNDIDGERFQDVIGTAIDEGYVIYNDWRGRKVCQLQAYQDCYDRFRDKYDWICFFDIDEFLVFRNLNSIEEFLSLEHFKGYDLIHVNWMNYNDSDKTEYEDELLNERFKTPVDFDTHMGYNCPENNHVKSIIRGGKENVFWKLTPHTPSPCYLNCCDENGISINGIFYLKKYSYNIAWLKHFSTKTVREYAWKMKRGLPDRIWNEKEIRDLVETRFFRTNKITKEKITILKEELGIDFSYLLDDE